MEIKTLKRKWARAYWIFLWGILLLGFLGATLPGGVKLLAFAALMLCGAGMILSILKLRCPYCGKGAPRAPAFSPGSGKTQYCSGCGKPFVYDDEI